MKTAAIICEFNPFHNGHAYLMRTLREKYAVDRIIAIMSGNYVQRGEPAIFDKYLRAESALIG
ncbi:MAG: nucleotidyltransferase family protein, partial [Eubacteriales bacterium]|nr:nucleotidyltransferase family protein [Eubacteriales bacterium]